MKYLIISLLMASTAFAKESFLDSVKRTKWGDLDVVWVEDDNFPKFSASIYFQDGALNDSISGLTQATFDQLSAGTKTETQREIAEFFDFYGANFRHSVTHEYSVYSVQALTKDIKPVMSKVCEIFADAQYPQNEFTSYTSRAKSHLKNLVTSHAALADKVFRKISLENTIYANPAEGTLASFDQLNPALLKGRLETLNKTRKVLYLAGPKDVRDIEGVIKSKCKWSNELSSTPHEIKKPLQQSTIYLVDVPNANQAQIRIGRYMTASEFAGKYEHFQFMSGFLGGGFTSKLVQELRVKRGLTYSAGAYSSMQRDYGRTGVITFSKNETTAEAISIVRDVFQNVIEGKFEEKEFIHQKNHQIGGYAFGFEETNAFLGQIMLYDHQKRDLKALVHYPENIAKMTPASLSETTMEAFPWDRLTIVVVGDKSLEKSLSRIRPVKVINYEDYL